MPLHILLVECQFTDVIIAYGVGAPCRQPCLDNFV